MTGDHGPRIWGNQMSGRAGGPVVQAGTIGGDVQVSVAGVGAGIKPLSMPRQIPLSPAARLNRDVALARLDRLPGRAARDGRGRGRDGPSPDRLTAVHTRLALRLPGSLEVSIEGNIDASLAALTRQQRRLFMALSEHPGPYFDADLAAAAVEIHPEDAQAMLAYLAGTSLITGAGELGGRYRLHDAVRERARHLAAAAEQRGQSDSREVVFARIVRYYMEAVAEADLTVLANRPQLGPIYPLIRAAPQHLFGSKIEALDWVEDELPNVRAVIEEAYRRGMHAETWQLAEALWGYFVNRTQFPDWVAVYETGLAAARAVPDPCAEQTMLVGLAQVYLDINDFGRAATLCARALVLSEQADFLQGEAAALAAMGTAVLGQGAADEAIGYYERARGLHERQAQPYGIAITLRHIGRAHRAAGRHDEALIAFTRSLRILRNLPDEPANVGQVLTELGRTHIELGQPDQAAELLEQARKLACGESPHREASALQALAQARRAKGEHTAAIALLQAAVERFTRLGAPEAEQARQQLAELAGEQETQP